MDLTTGFECLFILGLEALLLVRTSLAAVLHVQGVLLLQQADGATGALTVALQVAVVEQGRVGRASVHGRQAGEGRVVHGEEVGAGVDLAAGGSADVGALRHAHVVLEILLLQSISPCLESKS